ncbi:hypothetical protein GCM10023334_080390 [Nonomuraea thailandensis]
MRMQAVNALPSPAGAASAVGSGLSPATRMTPARTNFLIIMPPFVRVASAKPGGGYTAVTAMVTPL